MNFEKKAEEVWRRVFGAEGGCCDHGLIAAALEQAYREGVEAMRDVWIDSEGDTFMPTKCAAFLLSKSEEVK